MFDNQDFEIEGEIHGWWIFAVMLPLNLLMIYLDCSLWVVSIGSGLIGVIVNESVSYFKKHKLDKQNIESLKT
jgi:hypothetical protein